METGVFADSRTSIFLRNATVKTHIIQPEYSKGVMLEELTQYIYCFTSALSPVA